MFLRVNGIVGVDLRNRFVDLHGVVNHLHLVMRSRPDVVAAWSNQEVVPRTFLGRVKEKITPSHREHGGFRRRLLWDLCRSV